MHLLCVNKNTLCNRKLPHHSLNLFIVFCYYLVPPCVVLSGRMCITVLNGGALDFRSDKHKIVKSFNISDIFEVYEQECLKTRWGIPEDTKYVICSHLFARIQDKIIV